MITPMPQSDRISKLAKADMPEQSGDADVIERFIPTLWKERRRLAFVAICAFWAGFFFYARTDIAIFNTHAAFVVGAVYAMVIVPVTLVVCLFLPAVRFLIEAVAVTRLAIAMLAYTYPVLGATLLANPLLTALLVVSTGAILSRTFLHGRLRRPHVDGWLPRLKQLFTRIPAHIEEPTPLQHHFTAWVDATQPVRV